MHESWLGCNVLQLDRPVEQALAYISLLELQGLQAAVWLHLELASAAAAAAES